MEYTGTVGDLFEYAIALEKAAETLYKELVNRFAHYSDVAAFWRSYAEEEKGHASYLERIKADVDVNRLSRQADNSMLHKVQACLTKASPARLANIKTLEDAYQLASELENSETNAIFEFMIVNFSTDELAQAHKFLRTQLSTHIARLENNFPTPYKNRVARQSALVKENLN
jgi:rubrerythrin